MSDSQLTRFAATYKAITDKAAALDQVRRLNKSKVHQTLTPEPP